jgi:Zn-dependent protease
MKWSWKLGRFAGVDTYVHASFLLLVGWAAWAAWTGAGTGIAVLLGLAFLVGVFASVLLHELGHALAARRYGIRTRGITLLPIGGLAQLEGEPRTPKQELVIALAGPAVNFVLAAGLYVIVAITGLPTWGLLGSLLVANLSLGLFNLIPAFPMDGGRALRALVATRVGGPRATEIAVWIGKVAAIAFGITASAEGRRSEDVYYGTRYGRDRVSRPWLWHPAYDDGTWVEPAPAYASRTNLLRPDAPRVVVIFGRRVL